MNILLPKDTLVGVAEWKDDEWRLLVQAYRMGKLVTQNSPSAVRRLQLRESPILAPFVIDRVAGIDGVLTIISDVRPFITLDGKVSRSANRDYNIWNLSSYLTARWLDPADKSFSSDLNFAGTVFVSVVNLRLSHIYNLDGAQMVISSLVLSQYWGRLVRRGEEYTQDLFNRDIVKYSSFNPNALPAALLDAVEALEGTDIESLIKALKASIASPKLVNLNLTSFLTIMKPLVFIYRSDKIIPLSMEYPPHFVALTYMAMVDKSMRKSYLSTAVTNQQVRAKQQSETMLQFLNDYTRKDYGHE